MMACLITQCYQNISEALLMSAFILWPSCMCGFGIREKSDAVCGFLAYFCAVLRFLVVVQSCSFS